MARSDTMVTLDFEDIALVDTMTVSPDGRIYVGKEHAGEEVKIVAVQLDEDD